MSEVIECQAWNVRKEVSQKQNVTLDPSDWGEFRTQAHRMLDGILDYTQKIRQRPVWQPIPHEIRARFHGPVPIAPSALEDVHQEFTKFILPFAVGNVHPGFMGWVHGGGTPVGMLGEMLAAGLNANVGGRDQAPIEVERQIARWMQSIFRFPETASGLFVTGTSMANFVAVVIARDVKLAGNVRRHGLAANPTRMAAYASVAVHGSIAKALDLCGLGQDILRLVPTDRRGRMNLTELERAITKDREKGCKPFLIVGTAGTVDTGAVDDLEGLADLAHRERLWFHVDGAYGALAMLASDLAPKLKGIERADSLAFDFHKWGQVPYDAGFILVRDGALHQRAFASSSAYLQRETRGIAAGSPWPCDYGPELSRGFRALKTWYTLKVHGTAAIGQAISRTCWLARYLGERVTSAPELELLAPVELNIVCFRYRADDSDRLNANIVVALQESGAVVPSTTTLNGRLAIRAAIVNHRTTQHEIDDLVDRTLALGRAMSKTNAGTNQITSPASQAKASPRAKWLAELHRIEMLLEKESSSADLCFRRASLLANLGQFGAATVSDIRALELEPGHRAALNHLGEVLIATRHRQAARNAFKQAVLCHPDDPVSRGNYGYFLLEESERLDVEERCAEATQLKREAREQFERALRANPSDEKAHEGLYYLLRNTGEEQEAAQHRLAAFRNRGIIPSPYRGDGPPIPVLQLISTTGGNVRLQRFLDSRIFQTFFILPEFCDAKTPLPPHRLAVNGIGDAEVARDALAAAQSVLARTTAPLINSPAAVLDSTRSNNAKRLSGLPGVMTPRTVTVLREQLSNDNAAATLDSEGFTFPLLLRAPGFHTGQHFLKVDSVDNLAGALTTLPGQSVIVMQYVDTRGTDDKIRKYRVMVVDRQIYPLHVAISHQWKIHYMTAEMADNPDHRAEDAAFLENMCGVLGPMAMNALERIQSVLGLDYAGIDFGLNAKGEVVVFEANATMVVNPPDASARWNYRRPACRRIFEAVRKMLLDRASVQAIAADGR